jgi:hypothetical protein
MRKVIIAGIALYFASSMYAQTSLQTLLNEVWDRTKLDATTNAPWVREWAGYITLNSATGEFGLTDVVAGDWTPPDQGALVRSPPRPPDIPPNPSPIEPAIYVVARFHTHPPTTHATYSSRIVGPSQADYDACIHPRVNVPGFVYDYEADPTIPGPGSIPSGHPMYAPAKLYPVTPPERRPTP